MTSRADAQSNASNSTNTDLTWPNSYSASASDSKRARPTTSQRRPRPAVCQHIAPSDRTVRPFWPELADASWSGATPGTVGRIRTS